MAQSARATSQGIRSTVHIMGHPVHPILIPFPMAFLVAAPIADIVFLVTGDEFWATASLWLLAAGVVSGALAAVTGLIDFVTIERARAHTSGWIHLVGNVLVLAIGLANWLPRTGDVAGFVEPWGLTLSLVGAVLLGVTGWTGGELSYRHKIGVVGH